MSMRVDTPRPVCLKESRQSSAGACARGYAVAMQCLSVRSVSARTAPLPEETYAATICAAALPGHSHAITFWRGHPPRSLTTVRQRHAAQCNACRFRCFSKGVRQQSHARACAMQKVEAKWRCVARKRLPAVAEAESRRAGCVTMWCGSRRVGDSFNQAFAARY